MSTPLSGYPEADIPDVGSDVDNWGTILNATIAVFDRFGGGSTSCAMGSGNVTLNATEAQCGILRATGVLTATRAIYLVADRKRRYAVVNQTTGDFNLHVRVTGATGRLVKVPRNTSIFVYSNGTDVFALSPPQAISDGVASPSETTGGFPDYCLDLAVQRPGIFFNGAKDMGFARRAAGIMGIGLSGDDDLIRLDAQNEAANPLIGFGTNFNAGFFVKSSTGIGFATNAQQRGYLAEGFVFGTPSGGDKGEGSLNAQALYIDGASLAAVASSPEITVPTGNSFDLSYTHGLPALPRKVEAVLVCKTTEYGYAVGTQVHIGCMDTGNDGRSFTVWATATEVGLTVRNDLAVVRRDTPTQTATITHSRWRVIFHIIA